MTNFITVQKDFIQKLKDIQPIKLIVSSFFIIILLGTLLLMLPVSSRNLESTNFIDSLFVATSCTCVTGLTPFDTWSHWSNFGQIIVILLIQLGGLGVVTFTTGFTLFFRRKLGLRDLQIAKEYTSGSVMDTPRLIRTIIFWTLSCEIVGGIILAIRFVPQFGVYGIWISVFTSISAYCNAGFDILGFVDKGNSLVPYASDPLVCVTVALLIVIGGIGFIVVSDMHSFILKKKKNRLLYAHLNIHSKIVIKTTIFLLLIGTVGFMIFEYWNTLLDKPFLEKLNISFFQSASARTSGFFSVPIGQEFDLTKLLTIILMFIGASPASTGGGIKTTTFVVLLVTVMSVLKGKNETIVMNHKVSKNIVYKSLSIVFLAIILVFSATIAIDLIEENKSIPVMNIVFEVVSAFGTVGLTAGITDKLEEISKIILSIVMFIGRVGPISLILALTIKHNSRIDTVLPEGRIIVG